jgi:hypothetical protein
MIDKEILYKAIKKAEKNGYKEHLGMLPLKKVKDPEEFAKKIFFARRFEIIFSHDFAKTFFTCAKCGGSGSIEKYVDIAPENFNCDCSEYIKCKKCKGKFKEGWQHHLQQMVLEKEPLKYLEKFL